MMTILHDVKYSLRMLVKGPGIACATILILSLGIGGVTAVFGTLYTVMIQPLPYFQPDRLVLGRATYNGEVNPWLSGPDYVDYRDRSRSFTALEVFFASPFDVTATTGPAADRTEGLIASVGLFPAMGVKMSQGRPFTQEEGRDGTPPVVIVSHACWQKHFGERADMAGASLTIDGVPRDVVGVMPPDFHFIYDVDVWFPMRPGNLGPRRYNNWYILGRLADGVPLAQAQSEVDVIATQLEKTYPETNKNKGLLLTPLRGAFTEQYHTAFGLLGGGAGVILLIACANAAGLLVARGVQRHGELAVRAALGASRWRLMRVLLSEALVLAGGAGLLGAVLAVSMQHVLVRLLRVETLLLGDVGLSAPVLLFVLVATLATGVAFGLLPAWHARRVDVAQDLRASGRGTLQHGVRLRGGLVVGQVALSCLLLVVAGLLIRSLTRLHTSDPGFDGRNLLTVEVPLPQQGYSEDQRIAFFTSFLDGVRMLPGVNAAGVVSQLPIRNPYNNIDICAVGHAPIDPVENPSGNQRVVLPGYFEAMGIPLLAGRDIQPTDTTESSRVVVISKSLAQTLFSNRDPLGQHVVIDRDAKVTWEVVGVVGDVKDSDLYEETASRGTFYRAYSQQPLLTMRLAVRTAGDPAGVVAHLRDLLHKTDSQVPLAGPRTMEDIVSNATISEKTQTLFLAVLALLALTLAAIGVYGLLAYVVAQRQNDIGVRMALGAEPGVILGMVLGSGMKLVGIGLGLGIVGSFPVTRVLRSRLFGVTSTDAVTYGCVVAVLAVVASAACILPAWRAARTDPMAALRCE